MANFKTSFYYEGVVLACEAEQAPGNAAYVLSGTPDHPVTPEIFVERAGGKLLVWRSSNVVFSKQSRCLLGRDIANICNGFTTCV